MTPAMRENSQEIEQLLRSYAEGTGFPVDEFNRLRAERQAERRRLLAIQADAEARVTDEEEAAFVQAVRSQREAVDLFTSATVITLSQPEAISFTRLGTPIAVDFEKHFEPFNSSARVHIDTHTGAGPVLVSFQFPWENTSPSPAVINIGTLLRLTGKVEAISDNRFNGGDFIDASLSAKLDVVRGEGWGVGLFGTSVPVIGNISQSLGEITARGGGYFFGEQDYKVMAFGARPVGLGADFVSVPGGATVVITPTLWLEYVIIDSHDVDEFNDVSFDFGGGILSGQLPNRRIGCPFLHVEVLG
jgi:hypothetical protein